MIKKNYITIRKQFYMTFNFFITHLPLLGKCFDTNVSKNYLFLETVVSKFKYLENCLYFLQEFNMIFDITIKIKLKNVKSYLVYNGRHFHEA